MKYKIVEANSSGVLEQKINEYLHIGFKCIGGVSYVPPIEGSTTPPQMMMRASSCGKGFVSSGAVSGMYISPQKAKYLQAMLFDENEKSV